MKNEGCFLKNIVLNMFRARKVEWRARCENLMGAAGDHRRFYQVGSLYTPFRDLSILEQKLIINSNNVYEKILD